MSSAGRSSSRRKAARNIRILIRTREHLLMRRHQVPCLLTIIGCESGASVPCAAAWPLRRSISVRVTSCRRAPGNCHQRCRNVHAEGLLSQMVCLSAAARRTLERFVIVLAGQTDPGGSSGSRQAAARAVARWGSWN